MPPSPRPPWICLSCQHRLTTPLSARPLLHRRHLNLPQQSRTATTSKPTLPTTPVRTRFAPSPTGHLHLGSLRTALFNYLLARATAGQFLLRLEDTDAKRTVPGAEAALYEDLRWAGLQWDEGPLVGGPHGPYRQSERTAKYRDAAARLLESGHGYRCFCSAERLDELSRRRRALGMPTDYDRTCASLSSAESAARAESGEAFVVRLLAPAAYPAFTDLVYGWVGKGGAGANAGVTHKHGEVAYEDPVLLKSDGTPTYHLANVVDDHDMEITHVVRATEWISSTPKHLALYEAFGWAPPEYAHVGLLVDGEGRKLSKRNMDTGVNALREQGWLKEAVVNFAALLGCSYVAGGKGRDVMDLEELVQRFTMKFTKGNAVITNEKLEYLQSAHAERAAKATAECGYDTPAMRTMIGDLTKYIEGLPELQRGERNLTDSPEGDASRQPDLQKLNIVAQLARRTLMYDARNYTSPSQFYERNQLLFVKPQAQELNRSLDTFLQTTNNGQEPREVARQLASMLDGFLQKVREHRQSCSWEAEQLEKLIRTFSKDFLEQQPFFAQIGLDDEKKLYTFCCKLLRSVLVAGKHGPGMAATMELLGPASCIERLDIAVVYLNAKAGRTENAV